MSAIDQRIGVDYTADGVPQDCAVSLDNIQTVARAKLTTYHGHLSPEKIRAIHAAVRFALGFDHSE